MSDQKTLDDRCTCGRHPSGGVPLSVTALRLDGPMSLRDVTAATAKLMGHQLLYEDVLAVLERERKAGEVVRVSNGGDYRNHVWRALAPGEEAESRTPSKASMTDQEAKAKLVMHALRQGATVRFSDAGNGQTRGEVRYSSKHPAMPGQSVVRVGTTREAIDGLLDAIGCGS